MKLANTNGLLVAWWPILGEKFLVRLKKKFSHNLHSIGASQKRWRQAAVHMSASEWRVRGDVRFANVGIKYAYYEATESSCRRRNFLFYSIRIFAMRASHHMMVSAPTKMEMKKCFRKIKIPNELKNANPIHFAEFLDLIWQFLFKILNCISLSFTFLFHQITYIDAGLWMNIAYVALVLGDMRCYVKNWIEISETFYPMVRSCMVHGPAYVITRDFQRNREGKWNKVESENVNISEFVLSRIILIGHHSFVGWPKSIIAISSLEGMQGTNQNTIMAFSFTCLFLNSFLCQIGPFYHFIFTTTISAHWRFIFVPST